MYRLFSRFVRVNMPFYAVRVGRKPGVYATWSECESQVKGFVNPRYKKFVTEGEAWAFVNNTGAVVPPASSDSATSSASTSSDSSSQPKDSSQTSSDTIKPAKSGKRSAILLPFEEIAEKKSKSDSVTIFTDGCCHFNGKGDPRGGIGVYWGPGHANNLAERLPGRQTNNRAEIYAAMRAAQQAKAAGLTEVTICTDSEFLINCQTKWVQKWRSNGWKLSNGGSVTNREELEELCTAEEGIKITYEHVKGHCGIEGNEEADKLANAGAKKDLSSSDKS